MKKFCFVMNCFAVITCCVVAAVAVFTTVIFPAEMISPYITWQILLVSFLCAVSTLIYPWDRGFKKSEFKLRIALHYIIINIIVLGFGHLFDWYATDNMLNIIVMVIMIAVIFAVVSVVSWKKSEQDAKVMNENLQKYQNYVLEK